MTIAFKPAFIAAAALAVLAAPVSAQDEAVPAAVHVDPRPQYAAIAQLPDWHGVWAPDWMVTNQNRRLAPQFTPEAAATVAAYRAAQERGENLQGQVANCVPPGVPNVMSQPYPIEFLFRPGAVYVILETYSQVRRIYTDGRALPEDPDPYFNGHSIGRWDGETLLVETSGINPRNELVPGIHATEQTRINERIWLEAADQLVIETAITDPALFTEPYVTRAVLARQPGWDMREYVCAENNKDGADELGRPSMSLD